MKKKHAAEAERVKSGKELLGKKTKVKVTNSVGSIEPEEGFTFELNFGVTPRGIKVYIVGESEPLSEFEGQIIAFARRIETGEDILVAAKPGTRLHQGEIAEAIAFAEGKRRIKVTSLYEISSGAVVYSLKGGNPYYFIIRAKKGHTGFPKGHIERGESEESAAVREIKEETGLDVRIIRGFREVNNYTVDNKIDKYAISLLAEVTGGSVRLQEEEVEKGGFYSFQEALRCLTYSNDKRTLSLAEEYITGRSTVWSEEGI